MSEAMTSLYHSGPKMTQQSGKFSLIFGLSMPASLRGVYLLIDTCKSARTLNRAF